MFGLNLEEDQVLSEVWMNASVLETESPFSGVETTCREQWWEIMVERYAREGRGGQGRAGWSVPEQITSPVVSTVSSEIGAPAKKSSITISLYKRS